MFTTLNMQKASTILVRMRLLQLEGDGKPKAPGRKLVLKRERVFCKSGGHGKQAIPTLQFCLGLVCSGGSSQPLLALCWFCWMNNGLGIASRKNPES